MQSNAFWRYALAIMLVFILMALTIKYVFNDDARWQSVSAKGLQNKIQMGLSQMYWQWQQQGRASEIHYKPENVAKAYVVSMSKKGLPVVEESKKGCETFLRWFIDEEVINKQIDISTTFVQADPLLNEQKANTRASKYCRYLYAKRTLKYDLMTGQLTFTD